MLLDEPYRFAEAVSNRRDYIEDQLRKGSPVVGSAYTDGALLVTTGVGQQKLYEAYNLIAMGSVGHPTDIEKLRQAAIDLASVIGFNYSDADVTLQQIVHFGLGPAVKAAFDDIVRSPYIARVLLVEVDDETRFYTVDYDGGFNYFDNLGAVGSVPEADPLMRAQLERSDFASLDLSTALENCLKSWAMGRWVASLEEVPLDSAELDQAAAEADLNAVLKEALADYEVEALAVDRTRPGKNKCRILTAEEIEPVVEKFTR